MTTYSYRDTDLEKMCQEVAQFTSDSLPAQSPPEGFMWKPLVRLVFPNKKEKTLTMEIKWVAEVVSPRISE